MTIKLANLTNSGWTPRPKFREYENAFDELRKKTRARLNFAHLK